MALAMAGASAPGCGDSPPSDEFASPDASGDPDPDPDPDAGGQQPEDCPALDTESTYPFDQIVVWGIYRPTSRPAPTIDVRIDGCLYESLALSIADDAEVPAAYQYWPLPPGSYSFEFRRRDTGETVLAVSEAEYLAGEWYTFQIYGAPDDLAGQMALDYDNAERPTSDARYIRIYNFIPERPRLDVYARGAGPGEFPRRRRLSRRDGTPGGARTSCWPRRPPPAPRPRRPGSPEA